MNLYVIILSWYVKAPKKSEHGYLSLVLFNRSQNKNQKSLIGVPRGVHCTKLVRTHVSAQEGY
jgi:hypothetical protein